MKKINFLVKLSKEDKLKLVESSEEIKESYIKKSESSLASAKILLANEKLEESIALSYYSMYHVLNALLFKVGIKFENHTGAIIIMKEVFGLDNSDILRAKFERVDKQYYTDFSITRREVKDSIKNAEIFNSKLFDFISRLSNEDTKKYRNIFRENAFI